MSHRSWIRSVTLSLIFASLTVLSLPVRVLAGQLTLSWVDNSTTEDGFRIERSAGISTTFTQIATVGANVTSYTDGGLLDATTYCYRVQAFNAAGSSGFSNDQCATTAAATTSFTLTVNKSGTGSGTVTGTGINCGIDCSEVLAGGTSVVLAAGATSGSMFAGWNGGGCTGTASTCTVSMRAATTVTATFNAITFSLTVAKNGTGSGTVTATGINCGTDCSEPYTSGTSVVLTATTASGSTFAGWSGTGCGTGTVTVNGNMTCTATFNTSLTIGPSVSAKLTLSWTDNSTNEDGFRIERRAGSSTTFTQIATAGANVTSYTDGGLLDATTYCYRVQAFNAAGSSGYSNEQCMMTAAATTSFTLTVNKSGTGSGTVTGTGINCGADCSESYTTGTSVVLTAGAASGSTFAGWSGGGCTGTASTCTVSMSAAITVTASFNLASGFALTVNVAVQATSGGSASGRVVSSPAGIDCGTDCTEAYTSGRVVALTAIPGTGSIFRGWTGDGDCTDGWVTMNANKSCTANFALNQALLTVTANGNGTVDSTSGGTTCRSSCTFASSLGSTITVRATPSTGFSFTGWSGAGCKGTGDCTIILSADKSVTATFVDSGSNPTDKIGVYRPSTGEWFLDLNGNGVLENCGIDHCVSSFGSLGVPVVGDWDGSGVTQLGMFLTNTLTNTGWWRLDRNANETWEGCGVDICLGPYGQIPDIPMPGRWDLQGYDRIGVFRPRTAQWNLDVNGNGQWDGCNGDSCGYLNVYKAGDIPITGDWNGDGITKLGLFRPNTGEWFLDYNGNRTWDGCTTDRCLSFGIVGQPVSGDWDGSGTTKIGVFDPKTGEWFLDLNGNGRWDGCEVDGCKSFGLRGDVPVVGKW